MKKIFFSLLAFLFTVISGITKAKAQISIVDETVNLDDPTLADVGLLILSVTRFAVAIIGGVIILIIMYGGFQYGMGFFQGKEENEEALNTIKHGIIGLIIVLTAYIIVTFIQSALTTDF